MNYWDIREFRIIGDEKKPMLPACQIADVAGGSYPAVACTLALWASEQERDSL